MKKVFLLAVVLLLYHCTVSAQKNRKISLKAVADTNMVLPPAWAFGVLYGGYTNQQETMDRVKDILSHDYPIDAYWIDSWFWDYRNKGLGPQKYIDFIADTSSYPDRKNMWDYLQANQVKGGFWTWDCILKTGNEEAFSDFEKKGYFADVFSNTNTWHNRSTSTAMFQDEKEQKGTLCGNIDFNNPAAVAYFKKRMQHFFEEGADFIKLDRTSSIPVCRTMFEMSQEFGKETQGRGFLLSHTGGMETEEYKKYPAKWTDDTRSDWTIENPTIAFNSWVPKVALKENIEMYTDTAKPSSRIPFLTNDLGGFDMGKTDRPDEELYIRWMQFSMFCPITEVFSQPENPTANLAWNYSKKADSLFRFYAHLRMELFPYLYSTAYQARINGIPMIRKISGYTDEFMLGDHILVAPVYEKGAVTRTVFLPEGSWYNFWTEEEIPGNQTVSVASPLNQLPLFIKAGAIIPMRKYASSIEKGTNDTLTLHVYPGSKGSFVLYEDDGRSNEYLKEKYAYRRFSAENDSRHLRMDIESSGGAYRAQQELKAINILIHGKHSARKVLSDKKKAPFKNSPQHHLVIIPYQTLQSARTYSFKIKWSN